MSGLKKDKQKIQRRPRVRAKIFGTPVKPRISVFRSNNHIYAQLIDDNKGITLVSANDKDIVSKNKDKKSDKSKKDIFKKKESAFEVGNMLAFKAAKKKIKRVVFDRGGYKYHGRVAALAEGARKGGLKF